MISVPSPSFQANGLLAPLLLIAVTAAAHSPAGAGYRGRTSQHQPISFTISGGHLRMLRFRIDDTCPSGHVYDVRDWGFPPIQIRHSKFNQRFVSPPKQRASARVKGTTLRRRVKGTLIDRRYIKREHAYCRGTSTFDVRRAPPRRRR